MFLIVSMKTFKNKTMQEQNMTTSYSEFKGKKIISLKRSEEDTFPFSFGKTKAKLIVENFEEIKKFAEEE